MREKLFPDTQSQEFHLFLNQIYFLSFILKMNDRINDLFNFFFTFKKNI